jgi:hypothetical protein
MQRGFGYFFFPIPNHLRIFAMRFAMGWVYAVSVAQIAKPPRKVWHFCLHAWEKGALENGAARDGASGARSGADRS